MKRTTSQLSVVGKIKFMNRYEVRTSDKLILSLVNDLVEFGIWLNDP